MNNNNTTKDIFLSVQVTSACNSLVSQSADEQKRSCLGTTRPTCTFQGLLQTLQCSEEDRGGREAMWQTGKKYLWRHNPIRNRCYCGSLTPRCITGEEKALHWARHLGELMTQPRRRVTTELKNLFPVGSQTTRLHFKHITYLAGENHPHSYSCSFGSLWSLLPCLYGLVCFSDKLFRKWWIGGGQR